MKTLKSAAALLLALLLAASPAAPARAEDTCGELKKFLVEYAPGADGERLTKALEALPGASVLCQYSLLFSGAAIEAEPAVAEALAGLEGVERVAPVRSYSRPQAISDPLLDSNSLDLMGAAGLGGLGYNGDGMVIAVLDSGLRWTHRAFAENGLSQSPALSRQDVADFIAGGGTPGRYISPRIPFAYDYFGGDDDVSTSDSHGTHVSALALGYARDGDGAVEFRGVAPAAQLLSMKVFADNASSGTDDAIVLKALEDAYALGADVINLSLGTDNGFTADNALDGVYAAAFQTLREAGVVLCCAAGNASASVSAKNWGIKLPTGDYTDYGTVNAPASYLGATAVAAAQAEVYENAGYLAAGDRQISYVDSVSEYGEELPLLGALAEQALAYTAVGGVGTAADFAGVDVAGKIALVSRGTITFTEKARNAAQAGAAACLVYNSEPGTILPAVDGLTIPCAAISQEDGAYLLELAGEAGEGQITVSAGAYLVKNGGETAMVPESAWGTTSDLRLVPAMTAPGGSILSASALGDGLYEQMSGTSMSAPNAAGAFAVLLQALRERGIDSKAEAAALAEALLESTARLLTDGEGTPLSPRRQGAGLIDLCAALESPAVIPQPLLEVGDSVSGRFPLSFRVKNLTEEELALDLSATILTDAYDAAGADYYSLLAPLDITDRVSVSGPGSIAIPAGEEREISLVLTVDQSLRQELAEIYPNGFFAEGYICLTDGGRTVVHASFLGYCGDWKAAPIIEPVDFRDVLEATVRLSETVDEETGESLLEQGYSYLNVLPVNLGANLAYLSDYGFQTGDAPLLGENPWGLTAHSDKRSAIATPDSDALYTAGCLFTVDLYTLRNAAHMVMVVSDARTGAIYYVDDTAWLCRAGLDELTLAPKKSGWFYWDGTGPDGGALPNNTRVKVEFYSWLDGDSAMAAAYSRSGCGPDRPGSYRWLTSGSYDRCLEWSFPLVVDRQAPTVSVGTGSEPETIDFTLTDNQFLAHAAVYDGEGALLAEDTFADERAGTAHTLSVDLSGYELLPGRLYVTVSDYASNTTGCAVDVPALAGGEAVEPERCAMALLTDVDKEAWYHEAVDYVCTAGLMAGSEPMTFQPDDGATRAQVISILHQLADCPAPAEGEDGKPMEHLPFTDVQINAWYRDALLWAYSVGLADGYNETTFGAFAVVSRQQLAAWLYRFIQLTDPQKAAGQDGADLSGFPDSGRVSAWAEEAMAWAVGEGYLSGRADGFLAPRAVVTRAELAQVLMRFLEGQ